MQKPNGNAGLERGVDGSGERAEDEERLRQLAVVDLPGAGEDRQDERDQRHAQAARGRRRRGGRVVRRSRGRQRGLRRRLRPLLVLSVRLVHRVLLALVAARLPEGAGRPAGSTRPFRSRFANDRPRAPARPRGSAGSPAVLTPLLEQPAVVVHAVVHAVDPSLERGRDHHAQHPQVLDQAHRVLLGRGGHVDGALLHPARDARRPGRRLLHEQEGGGGERGEAGSQRVDAPRHAHGRADRHHVRARPPPGGLGHSRGERRGRIEVERRPQHAQHLVECRQQDRTGAARRQVVLEVRAQQRRQRVLAVVGEELLRPRAVEHVLHACPTSSARSLRRRASSSRPRLMRLFTVPSGICRVSAASSYARPCRSQRMMGWRRSAGSACRP